MFGNSHFHFISIILKFRWMFSPVTSSGFLAASFIFCVSNCYWWCVAFHWKRNDDFIEFDAAFTFQPFFVFLVLLYFYLKGNHFKNYIFDFLDIGMVDHHDIKIHPLHRQLQNMNVRRHTISLVLHPKIKRCEDEINSVRKSIILFMFNKHTNKIRKKNTY